MSTPRAGPHVTLTSETVRHKNPDRLYTVKMDAPAVRERAAKCPTEPGVYQFRADDTTLYVGKAVDLRSRVRSYTQPRSRRIERMVNAAEDVETAVTDTETQALLLEANLIKRHQPRYNVRLKDDKSYPLVQVTDHPAPRIEVTRDPEEGAQAWGPYTDKGRVETILKAIREVYGLRGCSDHKYAGRDRPCLDYEMGLCTAPCTGEIAADAYLADVDSARRFLDGETAVLADPMTREMERAAQEREFERAANLRDRLSVVDSFHEGGADLVAREGGGERTTDVLGVAMAGEEATVARLHAEGGKLVDRDRHTVAAPAGADREVEDDRAAVLAAFVPQFYAERRLPDALLLPVDPADDELDAWLDAEGVAVRVPGAGRESRLVDLALKNARRGPDRDDGVGALAERLDHATDRIEGFDVSHSGGRDVVGSNVCFVDGDPEKADYRRKKLDERNDDPAQIRALVRWRADRSVEGRDDRPDPDLLLVDGGAEQVRAAQEAIAAADWSVPVLGMAKGPDRDADRVVGPDGPTGWSTDDPGVGLLRRVRDEAHRFAVDYHRTVRDAVETELDDVPGVGPATRRRLLRRFGSVEGVRDASRSELLAVDGIGESTVEAIEKRL
jgi:excinuclease ABC subunit C